MAHRKASSFEEKLKTILDIDQEMKQVDAGKKHGTSQSTIAIFFKRKDNEDAVGKNKVDRKKKRIKGAVMMMLTNPS